MPEWMESVLGITALVSGVSLLAIWVPFYRGLLLCGRALGATRRLEPGEPLALRMLRVLGKSLRERDGHPAEFVVDASRQYAAHEYDTSYARPISTCANLLPPIGFIGTIGGLMILFLSMRVASDSLEIGALALALSSAILALVGFAVLKAAKIRLYARMLASIDDALAFYRSAARVIGGR